MTEIEWLKCEDPQRLLAHLDRAASPRKGRLFTVACCERIWPLLPDARSQNAVAALRRYADEGRGERQNGIGEALQAAGEAIGPVWAAERLMQCGLAREIFGNPFRTVAPDPPWRTANIVTLARNIYDERAFHRLPILADALQSAGCADAELMEHCRQPGGHVRGCGPWTWRWERNDMIPPPYRAPWVGWHRPHVGGPWRAIAECNSEAECRRIMGARFEGGESKALPAGQHPAGKEKRIDGETGNFGNVL